MKNYGWHACDPIRDIKELVAYSAKKYGSKDAFRMKSATGGILAVSYSHFAMDVDALGTALSSLGLIGKHIAIIGENSYKWVVSYLSIINGMSVVVPLDKDLPAQELVNIIRSSDTTAIIYSATYEGLVLSMLPQLPEVTLCIGMQRVEDEGILLSYDRLMETGRALINQGDTDFTGIVIDPDKMCVILYTSGTTGASKGVMLSHKNLTAVICNALRTIKVEKVTMSILPINHTYENSCGILTAIYGGVTVCFNDSLKYLSENLKLFKPHMLVLVPLFLEVMYEKIWYEAKKSGKDKMFRRAIKISNILLKAGIDVRSLMFKRVKQAFGGNLKLIICGGAPLRSDLVSKFRELGIQVLNGYGITECSPLVAVNRNRYYKDESVGVVIPCCEVKIDNPNSSGEGEILVRGDNVMLGYYKNETETQKAFDGAWFRTGDLGKLDSDGFLYITGRKKNTIILSNGKNVQPEEIEEYLKTEIPYIKETVVYAVYKDSGRDPYLSATIVPDQEYIEDMDITDIQIMLNADVRRLNRTLPIYKQLYNVRIQFEEFEKTTTRKIKRYKIDNFSQSNLGGAETCLIESEI